ncbi:MAG: hypothetical protein R6X25_02165 [Candidatus Krumholzibacteriia bacterium]
MIDATADVRGFSIVLEFDPDIVGPIAVTAGDLLTGAACGRFFDWLNVSAVGDSVAVDAALLGCSGDGPGSLLRIVFEGVEKGTSPLRCRRCRVRNSLNESIPVDCVAGIITYEGPVAVEAAAWGALKRVYR